MPEPSQRPDSESSFQFPADIVTSIRRELETHIFSNNKVTKVGLNLFAEKWSVLETTVSKLITENAVLAARLEERTKTLSSVVRDVLGNGSVDKNLTTAAPTYASVSVVAYGCPVWYSKLRNVHFARHVSAMQRAFLLLLTTAWRTTSTDALRMLAGVLPLELEITRTAAFWHIKRGLAFQYHELEIEPAPPDTSEDRARFLAKEKRAAVLHKLMSVWQSTWAESGKGRTTHSWMPEVRLSRAVSWRDHDRSTTCFLTGHGPFNSRLHSLGLSDTPCCACGAEDETWEHVLKDCVLYDEQRSALVKIVGAQMLFLQTDQLLAKDVSYEALVRFTGGVLHSRSAIEGPIDA